MHNENIWETIAFDKKINKAEYVLYYPRKLEKVNLN